MNPNIKVFAALKVNGIVNDWGHIELKYIPVKLGKFIMESEMDSRMFSSMDLRLSKRPISFESHNESSGGIDLTALANVVHIPVVGDDDPIDDESPPISYRELGDLSLDPIWTAYKSLSIGANRDNMNGSEYDAVVRRWKEKYAHTKFARLI